MRKICRSSRKTFLKAACLALATLLAPNVFNAENLRVYKKRIRQTKKQVEEVKKRLSLKESEIGLLKKEEKRQAQGVAALQQRLRISRQRLDIMDKQVRQVEMKKRLAQEKLLASQRVMGEWQAGLSQQLVDLYQSHLFRFRNPLWGQYRLYVYRQNTVYLQTLAMESKQELVNQIALAGVEKELVFLRAQVDKEKGKQKQLLKDREGLYQTARGRRLILEQETGNLEETTKDLEKLLANFEKRKQELEDQASRTIRKNPSLNKFSSTLASRAYTPIRAGGIRRIFDRPTLAKGRKSLPWPVEGTVVTPFGKQMHPEINTWVFHNGIEIKLLPSRGSSGTLINGSRESAVKTVLEGQVIYTGEFRSYGRVVILDHGRELYTIYGLLGNISVEEGEKLAALSPLGTVGPEHRIYFEIRSGRQPMNPLQWLAPAETQSRGGYGT